jgi:AcrR family transcriptional regulator
MPRTVLARPTLTQARIVDAAIEVADAEGIDALTLRRLAEALEVHPTSIYNHLASKEAILGALAEALVAEAGLATAYDDWRDWVRAFAEGLRRLARRHPGAFMVFTRTAAVGPAAAAHTEAALDALRRAGWSAVEAAQVFGGVTLALLGLALNECPPTNGWVEPDRDAVDPVAHPRIQEVLENAMPGDEDGIWTTTIDALIAGLAVQLEARRSR